MSYYSIFFVLTSVFLTSIAQFCLKLAMSSDSVQEVIRNDTSMTVVSLVVAREWSLWAGLLLYGLSVISWLGALSSTELSKAYPFVSLGIVITVSIGVFFLNEPVSWAKLVGVTLVVAGVFFIANS